ncbi:CU044_5270 family protein [Kitasatospora sp. NPDC059673]|uniref:CU044_5270 family protein n=1 Tax=Kitasatospora sp. NPDC059673 TaxID=3346901 RepID=UPI0036A1E7ED
MNASPSQPLPADRTEADGLLPTVERDLPSGRHQFHKERLMAQIHEDLANATPVRAPRRRNPFLRRVVLLPVAASVLAGAVVVGAGLSRGSDPVEAIAPGTAPVLTTDIRPADPKGAVQLLDRISMVAQESTAPQARAGQFVYIESKVAGTSVWSVNGKDSAVSEELDTRRSWKSVDGHKGWLIDRRNKDGISLDTTEAPALNAPSYNYLAALPTNPDDLLKKIYAETAGHGPGPDAEAFTTIGDLLIESYPSPQLTAALYKAAAKIPGVTKVDDAVDAAGRHGVAVARFEEKTGVRTEWIFDKSSLAFLGERTVQVEGTSGGGLIKPGTVIFTNAITSRAIVDGMKQTSAQSA